MADFKSNLQANIDAYFKDKAVDLNLLTALCNAMQKAQSELNRAARIRNEYAPTDLPVRVRIKHENCAEDFNYKNGLVWRCINILNGQSYE